MEPSVVRIFLWVVVGLAFGLEMIYGLEQAGFIYFPTGRERAQAKQKAKK